MKNLSQRLSDSELSKKIEELEKLSEDCVKTYNTEYFQDASNDKKIKAMDFFDKASVKLDELYKSINKMLIMYLQMKKF